MDNNKLLRSQIQIDKYKDFWLPWLDVVQNYLEKQSIKMVYEWSLPNNRLEFMIVFVVNEKEYITITPCIWGKSEEFMKRTRNEFIQRIVYEKNLKEAQPV